MSDLTTDGGRKQVSLIKEETAHAQGNAWDSRCRIGRFAGAVAAQNYPHRPITMIIPFAAGGPTDVLGRVIGQRMREILGQQVVVENVGGAGGMTGSRRVADAGRTATPSASAPSAPMRRARRSTRSRSTTR